MFGTPSIVAVFTFYIYSIVQEQTLTSAIAFSCLSLLNMARNSLIIIPSTIVQYVAAKQSFKRLYEFFSIELIPELLESRDFNLKVGQIRMDNEKFYFNPDSECPKCDLLVQNLLINQGEFAFVVGAVGSGKSAFINAILGDIISENRYFKYYNGTVSYASQSPWIINGTIRDNIVMGRFFDYERYKDVLRVTGLVKDLQSFPAKDLTEIGEKGINLSGGQRQRLCIARAVYYEADIYIFDDPLSALDAHVCNQVFKECFQEFLKGKTRIIVSHHVQYSSKVDKIICLGQVSNSGAALSDDIPRFSMLENGKFAELCDSRGEFFRLFENLNHDIKTAPVIKPLKKFGSFDTKARVSFHEDDTPLKISMSQYLRDSSSSQFTLFSNDLSSYDELVEDENIVEGELSWDVYKEYIKSSGVFAFFLYVFAAILFRGGQIASDVWISEWTHNSEVSSSAIFIENYFMISAGSLVFLLLSSLFLVGVSRSASRNIHQKMLICLLKAPIEFFDVTPVGRIINRFSRDMDNIDNSLPLAISSLLTFVLLIIGLIGTICFFLVYFLAALIPICFLFYFAQSFYGRTSRLYGTTIIRVLKMEEDFEYKFSDHIDENSKSFFILVLINRWLGIRLNILGALILLLTSLFMVYYIDHLHDGIVGLILSYCLSMTSTLNLLVRSKLDLELQMNSIERTMEYSNAKPEMESSDILDDKSLLSWPSKGDIMYNNVSARYRNDTPLVLKDLNISIQGGKKVGICGRTGSGKSSLLALIYRIIPCHLGSILIDGIDISKVSLKTLRSRLAIVPQEPVLFGETIRWNLDPFSEYDDSEIWHALDIVNLKTQVESLNGQLEFKLSEFGNNFSAGQKQLICFARAILRKPKILICDEATASIDLETDNMIQKMLRTHFSGCTIISIAHRVSTILDYDKILVLNAGNLQEYDSPQELIKTPNSQFAHFCSEANFCGNFSISE
jgi:ABC-type multidrug transport system fused ATPase/permease subunit